MRAPLEKLAFMARAVLGRVCTLSREVARKEFPFVDGAFALESAFSVVVAVFERAFVDLAACPAKQPVTVEHAAVKLSGIDRSVLQSQSARSTHDAPTELAFVAAARRPLHSATS